MIPALAPEAAASLTLAANEQAVPSDLVPPRSISAIFPLSDPGGRASHARPPGSASAYGNGPAVPSNTAELPLPRVDPIPVRTFVTGAGPATLITGPTTCAFVVAPTVMAEGAIPGEVICVIPGSRLPAAITATRPAATA